MPEKYFSKIKKDENKKEVFFLQNMHSQPYNMKDFAWEWEIMIQ